MRLPEIEQLHSTAIEKLKAMQDGGSKEGFGALVDAARYFAVCDVCSALRRDLAGIDTPDIRWASPKAVQS